MNLVSAAVPAYRRREPIQRYLSLIYYKTYADLRAESERTYVGFLWWIVEPIVSMAVYYLVFSVILNRGGEDYVAFLFAGVVPWRWFQTTIMRGSSSILSARGLMQEVYLPKMVLPVVALLVDTFKFLVVLVLLLAFVLISGHPVTSAYLALPLLLLTELLVIGALTLFAAALIPFVPDLRVVLQNLLRLLFFLSGVFYDLDRFSPEAQHWLRLNPMAVLLESFRQVLLEGEWPNLVRVGAFAAGALVILVAALWLLRRYDYVYPKLKF